MVGRGITRRAPEATGARKGSGGQLSVCPPFNKGRGLASQSRGANAEMHGRKDGLDHLRA